MGAKNTKTIIIAHGGAIKGAFAAGAIFGLSKIGIEAADIILGTSSSAPTMAYFASKQFGFMRNIWRNEVGTKKFIRYKNLLTGEPIFDLNYLINTVFKRKYPLRIKDIVQSKSDFLVPLYNYEKKKLELHSSREKNFARDFWKILLAAMTIHDKDLLANYGFETFVDADLDPFALYREKHFPYNSNILIILNHKKLNFDYKKRLGLKIFAILQSKNFPKEVKNMLQARKKLIASGLNCFEQFQKIYRPIIIYPPAGAGLSPMSIIVRNHKKLRSLFDAGERTTADIYRSDKIKKKLKIFIKRSKELKK